MPASAAAFADEKPGLRPRRGTVPVGRRRQRLLGGSPSRPQRWLRGAPSLPVSGAPVRLESTQPFGSLPIMAVCRCSGCVSGLGQASFGNAPLRMERSIFHIFIPLNQVYCLGHCQTLRGAGVLSVWEKGEDREVINDRCSEGNNRIKVWRRCF